MDPYSDSLEHLSAELARMDALLHRELAFVRLTAPEAGQEEFRGLVITEVEADALARQTDYFGERWRQEAHLASRLGPFDDRATALLAEINGRVERSYAAGVDLAIPRIARRFGLSRTEVDLMLLALAPELEPRYETLFAYMQNDVTRKRPSVELVLNILCRSSREKVQARQFLHPQAPLLTRRLVSLGEESHDRRPSFLRKFLKLEERVADLLLGPALTTAAAPAPAVTLQTDAATTRRLENLVACLAPGVSGVSLVRLTGPSEPAARTAAEWVGQRLHRPVLFAELAQLERDEDGGAAVARDAMAGGGLLAVTASGGPVDDDEGRRLRQAEQRLWRLVASLDDLVLLVGGPSTFVRLPPTVPVWHVEIQAPDFPCRRDAWSRELGNRATEEDSARLAESFRFGQPHIGQTVALAGNLASLREPAAPVPSPRDVLDAGRILSTPELRRFAVRVEPRYTWDDIVLPADKLEQLRRLANWTRFRHQVHETWGFGRKLVRGKGLNVLFAGPSGTGKTMAAEVLASELALDLYQIDLSSVVSKYIGETEKHLSEIFREAADSQAVLFFDEADALFGKRTEIKDAHDRYANIEVNFLLQRVEQYDGIVILATNLQRNVDEAFLRRLHDVLEFPFPDEALRERIWRGHFPRDAWKDPGIDFPFLARQFKLTGGSIKNIVLDAAFRAAAGSGAIAMEHLIHATRSEFQKQGKLPNKTDFDRYYGLVQPMARMTPLVGS